MYHAIWIETRTHEDMRASAASLEELNIVIYGRAYQPMHNSVMIWKDPTDGPSVTTESIDNAVG